MWIDMTFSCNTFLSLVISQNFLDITGAGVNTPFQERLAVLGGSLALHLDLLSLQIKGHVDFVELSNFGEGVIESSEAKLGIKASKASLDVSKFLFNEKVFKIIQFLDVAQFADVDCFLDSLVDLLLDERVQILLHHLHNDIVLHVLFDLSQVELRRKRLLCGV